LIEEVEGEESEKEDEDNENMFPFHFSRAGEADDNPLMVD